MINCDLSFLPSSITSCNVITSDGVNGEGYEGLIKWVLGGIIKPGETGVISYRVEIN